MKRLRTEHLEPEQRVFEQDWPLDGSAVPARKTILFAEDDDELRYIMQYSLNSMGYSVVAAADAYSAASAFRSHGAIDFLLTDYEMPGRTGMELARELTGLQATLPVMILTGSSLQQSIVAEIDARHWSYVSKPCHLAAMALTLRLALQDRAVAETAVPAS